MDVKHLAGAASVLLCGATLAHAALFTLDFEQDADGAPIVAGQTIDDEYTALGVTIAASNNAGGRPDRAIAFDTASPTGGDPDLATPGDGIGNDHPLGIVLILPENGVDADNDGLIDNPDDDARGGTFYVRFDAEQTANGTVTLIDIEEGGRIERYLGGVLQDMTTVDGLGDNSVQTVDLGGTTFDEMRIVLSGSGAFGELQLSGQTVIPEPATVAIAGLGVLMFVSRSSARRRKA